ncbi:MAG: threonine ammonia-lyase [Acidimicrobiales bacterium]
MTTVDDIERAAARIAPYAHRTPVVTSTRLDEQLGAQIFCKAESMQRTGSFKFRGATNAVASLDPTQGAKGILTHSSGNHGQAIARAAALHGYSATVVMPSDAPPMKRRATEHWGAAIVPFDRYEENRDDVVQRVLAESGATLIPPFDHPDVIAGQGTTAVELFDQVEELDMLFVCVGGGGLLGGCATVAKARNPNIVVVGVEPDASDDHVRSRAAGHRVELDAMPRTIADGQQLMIPGELTWPITNALTDHFVSVSDDEIASTMRTLFAQHKLVVEPSGASALAAAIHRGLIERGARVGVTLSGGNVEPATFFDLINT